MMNYLKNKKKVRNYLILFGLIVTLFIVCTLALFSSVKDSHPQDVNEVKTLELKEKQRILEDSVADLKLKVQILNKYLNMKHLEFIEACDLVDKREH